MPEHPSGDRTPRTPRARDAFDALGAWQRSHPLDLADRGHEREVAGRPDVGASERHQEVDVRGPGTDASQFDQRGSSPVVVERGKRAGIELACHDRLSDSAYVRRFLPSEPGASQLGLGQGGDPFGRHGTGKALEPSVSGAASR
jgi:hypothetical protein